MKKLEQIENIFTSNYSGDSWIRGVLGVVNSYSGAFGDLECFENDEDFFEAYFYDRPFEVARSIFFGDYNYNDEYVRFNGYGNLESLSEYEYEKELEDYKKEILEALVDEWDNIKDDLYIEEDVRSQIDKIINDEEEEEEEE